MNPWLDLTFIIVTSSLLSFLIFILKQPIISSYILTGFILSPLVLNLVHPSSFLNVLAEMGLALLLFLTGLQMNFQVLKNVGRSSIIVGVLQIIFTTIVGFFLAKLLNFSTVSSFYLGLGLAFSSTAVIIKILSDTKLLHSLIGHLSIGYLLIQDFIALVFLGILSQVDYTIINVFKALLIFISVFLVGEFIINRLVLKHLTHHSASEIHFLITLSWLFSVVTIFKNLNIPFEIGTFLAGLSLASSPVHYELAQKLKPLRDFFIMIFFVLIGTKFVTGFSNIILRASLFSLFVLIGNPLITYPILRKLKYPPRASFITSLTVGQVSEFSIILASLGYSLGHIPGEVVSLISLVALITIFISSFLVKNGNNLYSILLKIKHKKTSEHFKIQPQTEKLKLILLGVDRTGTSLLKELSPEPRDVLLIDFNPEKQKYWEERGYQFLLKDIEDPETFDEIPWEKAKIIVSTIPNIETNLYLLRKIKNISQDIKFLSVASDYIDKNKLIENGADVVILPQETAGMILAKEVKPILTSN
jgi:Kef-type K+ transport system membrane component KefB